MWDQVAFLLCCSVRDTEPWGGLMHSENSLYCTIVLNLSPTTRSSTTLQTVNWAKSRGCWGDSAAALSFCPCFLSLSSSKPFANVSRSYWSTTTGVLHPFHLVLNRPRSHTRAELSGWQEKRKSVWNLRKCQLLLRVTKSLTKTQDNKPMWSCH